MNESTIKILGISCLLIFLSFYFLLNRKIKEAKLIHSSWDDRIPFIAWSVFPYLFFYAPLLYGSIFISFFQPLKDFYEFLFSFLIVLSESFLTFILYPTRVKEYEVLGTTIWDNLMRKVYQHDKRVTSFPSIHVGISLVMTYYLYLWYPNLLFLFACVAISIVISTVTTKQHSIIDVVGGCIAAACAILLGKVLLFSISSYLLT